MPDLAMFYLDLVEEAGLDKVHLIGNSLGGWLAAEILIRDRSRFGSLVQLAPAGIRVKGVACGDNFIWGPEEAVRNLYHDQGFADRVLALTPDEAQMDVMLRNRFTVAKFGWQPRWFNPDLEKWLHRIKLPALVVWGDDDKIMPPEFAALWRERLPDARVVMVEGCGHLPHVEKAPLVARQVLDFLEGAAS
jgi:pimeloyl-ACP methyl ester carboxylesterase